MAKCDPKSKITFNNFYKTKLCPWFKKGVCRWGEHCNYAHSEEEQRGAVDLTKTTLCPHLEKNDGHCSNPRCRYAHTQEELRATHDVYKTSMCSYFLKDHSCPMGNKCRYAHGPQELRPKPSMEASVFFNHPYCSYVDKPQSKSCTLQQKVNPSINNTNRRSSSLQSIRTLPGRSYTSSKPSLNGFMNDNTSIPSIPAINMEWAPNSTEMDGESLQGSFLLNAPSQLTKAPHLQAMQSSKMNAMYWGIDLMGQMNGVPLVEQPDGGKATQGASNREGELSYFLPFTELRNEARLVSRSLPAAEAFSRDTIDEIRNDAISSQCNSYFMNTPGKHFAGLSYGGHVDSHTGAAFRGSMFREALGTYDGGVLFPAQSLEGSNGLDNDHFNHADLFSLPYSVGSGRMKEAMSDSYTRCTVDDIHSRNPIEKRALLDLCSNASGMPDLFTQPSILMQPTEGNLSAIKGVPSEFPLETSDADYSTLSPELLPLPQTWNPLPSMEQLPHLACDELLREPLNLAFPNLANAVNGCRDMLGDGKNDGNDKAAAAPFSNGKRLSNENGSRTNLCLMDNTSTTITTSSDHDSQLTNQTTSGLPQTLLQDFLTTEDVQTSYNSGCTSPKNGKVVSYVASETGGEEPNSSSDIKNRKLNFTTDEEMCKTLSNEAADDANESQTNWSTYAGAAYNGCKNEPPECYRSEHWDALVSLMREDEKRLDLHRKDGMFGEEMQECLLSISSLISGDAATRNAKHEEAKPASADECNISSNNRLVTASTKMANRCDQNLLNFYSNGFNGCDDDNQNIMEQRMVLLESEKYSLLQENEKLRDYLKKLIGI